MRKIVDNWKILLVLLIGAIGVQAIFSCSSDGFESNVAANVSCYKAEGELVELSEKLCLEMGWTVVSSSSSVAGSSSSTIAGGGSSSSGEGGDASSSSVAGDVSSSSGEGGDSSSSSTGGGESSSSSVPPSSSSVSIPGPVKTGDIDFVGLNQPHGVYFIGDDYGINNTVKVSNHAAALCATDETTIRIETTPPNIIDEAGKITGAGTITVTAVANCNGTEHELEKAIATVVPDPDPASLECVFGEGSQHLMHRGETLNVVVNNVYDRCDLSYSFGSTNNATGSFSLSSVALGESNATATITCGSNEPVPKECSKVFVAEGYVEARCNHSQGPFGNWRVPAATTIIEHACCQPKLRMQFNNCFNDYTLLVDGFAKMTSTNNSEVILPDPLLPARPEAYPDCRPYPGSNPSPGDILFHYPKRILMEATGTFPSGGFTCESW
ncbi:MAG: hypothetical protein LBC85_01005 [Fibromonadaceae bacterium]|jgi:hypothetical protein|nr:hypothetical protein [Fibromonadaceae bacterium]